MMPKQRVLLVFTTANQLSYTIKSLESIKKCNLTNLDLLVVDDASADGTVQYCKDHGIPILSKNESLGLTNSWNMAYKEFKKGGYNALILANNDVLIPRDAVTNLLKVLKNYPIAGVLSNTKGVPYDLDQALENNFSLGIDDAKPENYEKVQELLSQKVDGEVAYRIVERINGFFFGVSRDIIHYEFNKDLLFNPKYINVNNEYELCERVNAPKVISKNSFVFHFKGVSFKDHAFDPNYEYSREYTWDVAEKIKKNPLYRIVYRIKQKAKNLYK